MTENLNEVRAGKYQLVAARWDQITSKPGEPLDYIRHRRGDIVDLSAEDAKRLVAAGAVVKPGQLEKDKAEQARAEAERAAAQYKAILAGLPEDVRAEVAPGTVAQTGDTRDAADSGGSGGSAGSGGSGGSGEQTIADILKHVGDDKAKATAALAGEQAKGDKARPRLVEKLQAIVAS